MKAAARRGRLGARAGEGREGAPLQQLGAVLRHELRGHAPQRREAAEAEHLQAVRTL